MAWICCSCGGPSATAAPEESVDFMANLRVSDIAIDGKPIALNPNPEERAITLKLTRGPHKVVWKLAGVSHSAEFEVGSGGGDLSLVNPPLLIHVYDNVKVTKKP